MGKPPSRVGPFGWMIGGISGAIGWVCPGVAQNITLDGTLGPARTLTGPVYLIQQRDGRSVGPHLFHSFGRFNLDVGEVARFHHAAHIQNIFARVTGGSASTIDGLIATNGGQVNLFLLNPSGILFGPNASLQVGGSFVATTASHIRFPDGSQFSAVNPQGPPLLKINLTSGLQYGRPQGDVANAGHLTVGQGQRLTLLGRTVTHTGRLTAPGGRVEVLGDRVILRDPAQVDVSAVGNGGTVLIGGDFQGKGTVPNAQSTFIGPNVIISANGISPTPSPPSPITPTPQSHGGRVIVWADDSTRFYGKITARGGANSGNGGFVEVSGKNFLDYSGQVDTRAVNGFTGTLLLDPTDITIIAGFNNPVELAANDQFSDPGTTTITNNTISSATTNVTLQATNSITFNANVAIAADGIGLTAQAGNNIFVNSQIRTNRGTIRLIAGDPTSGAATTTGSITIRAGILSRGGDIFLNAGGGISISDDIIVQTDPLFAGNSGNITIETGQLVLQNRAQISASTFGVGNAGNVTVRATEINLIGPQDSFGRCTCIASSAQRGAGNAGNITIQTEQFIASGMAAEILASTLESGNAGTINIQATGIEFSGNSSGLFADAAPGATGNAGQISVATRGLLAQDGAIVTAQSSNATGGNLEIRATDSVRVLDQSFVGAGSSGQGAGGNLLIDTPNLTLDNGSVISTGTFGQGQSGSIKVRNSDSVVVSRGSVIGAVGFETGRGGEVSIATRDLTVRDNGSGIVTSSTGSGNAGNLTVLATNSVNVLDGGLLSTGTVGSGSGSNLLIEAQNLNLQNEGRIFTSSLSTQTNTAQGNSGDLTIRINGSTFLDNSIISTLAQGRASGGRLSLTTNQLTLQNGANISSATLGQGQGGNIDVQANSLILGTNGLISSRSEGQGRAANIALNVTGNLQSSQGEITATSFQSGGGNINITAEDILLRNSSLISSSVFDSTGGGGDIIIRSRSFVALEDSDILANAEFGPGGNIFINSPVFLADLFNRGQATAVGRNPGSFGQFRGNGRVDISADSRFGTSGTVTYPNLDLTRGLIALPVDLTDPSNQLDTRCQPGTRQATSSYIETGRSGLPHNPEDPLIDETVTVRWAEVPQTSRTPPSEEDKQKQKTAEPIVEGQILQRDAQGDLWLVAQTSHPGWFAPPECQPHQP